MSNLTIQGELIRIGNTEEISDKFKKREFVIKTEDRYPQTISFELFQENIGLVDSLNIKDQIEIYFNINGREWRKSEDTQPKVFNTLVAWKINVINKELNTPPF
tara:strand:+ start:91 stop:402 length:312 start_codon:yes stop_codon:yes gene_type:complete